MSRGLAVGLAGAAIGSFIPGVGPLMGYAVGSAVGSALFGPKAPDQEGPRLKDLNVITSQEGAPIPKVYGSARLSGNVIWGKPLQDHKKKKKAGGGKGGGSPKVTTYTYTLDFALGLCEGEIAGIVRMWDNGKLILDASPLTAAEQAIVSGGGYVPDAVARFSSFFNKTTELIGGGSIRVYPGSETQMPDPLIEADLGVGNTPAYRGLAYIVFDNYPTQQMPNITVEVVASGTGAIEYLGELTIPQAAGAADRYQSMSHYLRASRSLIANIRHNNFANSAINSIDPVSVYASGVQQIGTRNGSVLGDGGEILHGDSDVPAIFTVSGAPDGRLHSYSASADGLTYLGSFLPGEGGTFSKLYDSSAYTSIPMVVYKNGVFWVWHPHTGYIYRALPFAGTATIHGPLISTMVSGVVRGVAVGDAVLYVMHGTSPSFTLSAFELDSLSLVRTTSFSQSIDLNKVKLYAQDDSSLWMIYDNGADLKIAKVINGAFDYVGVLSRPFPAGIKEVRGLYTANFAVSDGLAILHYPRSPAATAYVRYWALNTLGGSAVPLSTIVADVCESAGLGSSLVNVTDLAGTMVKGYIRTDQMRARAALEPLSAGFFFDAVESGPALAFRRRGGAVVKTISADDLGTTMGDTPVDRAATTIVQDNELPIELDLQYIDPARDYQVGSQRSRRQIPASEKVSSVTMPIVWTGTEAKQAVEKLHYTAWEERNQYKLSLPIRYLALEPGDAITVPVNGFNRRLRITRTELGNTLECEAVSDFAASYVSEAVAASNPTGPQVIKVPGTTIAVLLDIPILADSDNDAGLYIAAMGTGSGWTGAEIFKSVDGVSYESVDTITSESTIGSMVDLLPAGSTTVWDDGPAVKVRLLEGTMESVTDLEAMAGANTAAIGANGRWEIVSFANAVLNGDGTYSLSRRIRGRKGTEWAVGLHAASDTFVLLEAGDLIRNVPATSDIGGARYYKAVSFGESDGDTMNYTHQAVGLEPYAVAHIAGRRHAPATNDWTISWVRRGRLDGEWRDYVDVPLGETSEAYEVEIMSGSTVKRTITGITSQSTVYTAAQQNTDFGSVQTTLSVRVYQISGTVGRGYVSAATV